MRAQMRPSIRVLPRPFVFRNLFCGLVMYVGPLPYSASMISGFSSFRKLGKPCVNGQLAFATALETSSVLHQAYTRAVGLNDVVSSE